jgi:4-amino-4-deoxy-L-arabinose transferase-like glycosyltransferase
MMPQRTLLILLAAVAISVLISPVQRELYVGDETKYAQVVREVRAGSWFLPTLQGTPFTHKPPVHFWMIGALTYPLGVYSTWAFVLPSILAFLFLLWLMWKMEGPLAAFICGTSLMVWGSAQTARMDVGFTAMITLAALLMRRGAPVWSGVALGVATLIKGPMAPVIGILLFLFARPARATGRSIIGVLLMIAIPLAWFIPATQIGGSSYTEDVLVKQTAGRAVGAWVHKAAPWFYIAHAPADLFPWFFLFVVALVAAWKRKDPQARFYVAWVLAVFVPYSLLSSKLDVYMMTLIPPVAALVARLDHSGAWVWRANVLMLGLLLGAGTAGYYFAPAEAKALCIVLGAAALLALILALRWRDVRATLLVGATPIVSFLYAAIFLVPVANEMASTRPAVRALVRQNVPPEEIALFTAPHLWTRDMPRSLERVRYVDAGDPAGTVVLTSRRYAKDIDLSRFRRVDSFQMIGKWFDVYRR